MNAWLPRTRPQWLGLGTGVAALVACLLLGLWHEPRQALLGYLYAFCFFTGLSVGSLALLMVHALTGGQWGYSLRVPLLAAAGVLPLMAVAALPLLLGMRVLYAWGAPGMAAQGWYLNEPFFVLRTLAFFGLWIGWLLAFMRKRDAPVRARRIAAPGLVVVALTGLLAAIDWLMSLAPHWHSSVFGMMVTTGWMLGACALACASFLISRRGADAPPDALLRDFGNLLLMFVLAWSYLAFMQYLTVWIADLPDENSWYIPRTLTSWRWLAWFLIAFNFALPFGLLLSRAIKRRPGWIAAIAVTLVVANFADAFWLAVPGFRDTGFSLRWSDLLAPIGLGGLWWCAYAGGLHRQAAATPATTDGTLEHSHG